jgi:hypothetical protein
MQMAHLRERGLRVGRVIRRQNRDCEKFSFAQVTAAQIPLTSLEDDIAVTRLLLSAQKEPTVLVGHRSPQRSELRRRGRNTGLEEHPVLVSSVHR